MKTINLLLLLLFGAVACAQSVQAASVAVVNTAWDEGYLYMAVRVESANVRGSHSTPNASVAGDDTVSFYLSSKDKLGVNTCVLEISAASGSQLRVGTAQGILEPKQAFTFKYGVTVNGTLNKEDDVDKGYLVEAAIPWQLIGLSKAAGAKLRFNIVVKDADGKQLSLSSAVESETDMIDPSKWSTLELAQATPAYKADRSRLISQTYSTKAPMIDGIMKPEEWLERHVVAFSADGVLPVITAEPSVPTELTTPVEPSVPAEPILPIEPSVPAQAALSTTPKRVFASYYYWFQADPNRGLPVENIVDSTGKSLLKDTPVGGIGPWLTYDSVQWHLDQLQQASDTGVDILLPVYRGDKASRSGYATRGLDNIIVALDQISEQGGRIPTLGLFLDTEALRAAYGSKPNLADEEVQSALYGMIKEFFDRVPVQYRALVKTPASGLGHVVFLGSSSNFSELNSEAISYCKRRFMQDFGKQLIWAVGEGYVGKLTGYDAVVSTGAGLSSSMNTIAGLQVISVGPGYSLAQPEPAQVRGRENFATDFNTAIAANPDWIVLDSWNNYSEASEIAPSVEHGSADMEIAKSAIQRFKNPGDYDAGVDWLDIPNVIQPKEFNVARIRVRNAGKQAWTAQDKVSIGYRWYRDGKYYADSGIKVPLSKSLQPGESLTMNFGIAPVDESKSALPEGAAELRIELFRASDNKWFGELGGSALMLPVLIAPAPEYSMSIVQSDIPQVLAVNEPYKAKIYIRNEGFKTWPAESGRLTGKLYRSSSYTHDSAKVFEPVGVADIDVKLPYDSTASSIAEIPLDIKLPSAEASALPESQPQNPWSYYLVFDVTTDGTSVSAASSQTHMVAVSIYSYDSRAFMADAQVPDSVKSGQKFQVKVALRNDSPRTWTSKNASVALHWYDASGNAVQEAGTIKLKKNILTGKFTVVAGEIVAPASPGSYTLVVDMLVDAKVASKSPVRHAGDQLIKRVEVTGK